MKACFSCKSKRVEAAWVPVERCFGDVRVVIDDVPVERCADCGEWAVGLDEGQRADQLAALVALGAGVRTPDLLKRSRKLAGLRAAELAELLGVTAETVSRWENGHRQAEPAVWNAFADLVDDALRGSTATRDRLSRRTTKRVLRTSFIDAA